MSQIQGNVFAVSLMFPRLITIKFKIQDFHQIYEKNYRRRFLFDGGMKIEKKLHLKLHLDTRSLKSTPF